MTQLYNNITRLLNEYFYKTVEKPVKYNEWLDEYYFNGIWYIGNIFYDDCTKDNNDKYNLTYLNNQSFTYDEDSKSYNMKRTTTGFGTILIKDLTVPNTFMCSVDFKLNNGGSLNVQPRIVIYNENGNGIASRIVYASTSSKGYGVSYTNYTTDGAFITSQQSADIAIGEWYTINMFVDNYNIIEEVYDSNKNLIGRQYVQSNISLNNNKIGIQHCYTNGASVNWRNLKVIY